jgi:hypothetical protein
MRTLIVCAGVGLLAACNAEQYEPINIAVYPSVKVCAIEEQPLDCAKTAVYLRDTLKASAGREITVSYAGTETVEKGDTSVEQIAELIKAAGYKNVRAVRYEMK